MFNEYFHGDDGAGLGATHQTGWTGLVADLIRGRPGDGVYASSDLGRIMRRRADATTDTERPDMHVPDDFLDAVRTQGFAIMEGFLDPDEVGAVREALFGIYPRPEQYFADPDSYRHLVASQFSGLTVAPFESRTLNRLAVHPDLVDAAERFCGTADLQVYKIELWAKYSGTVDYDQPHHRDYGNHNMVVPRADGRWPQLTSFILLSDVTEADGPTRVVPRRSAIASR